MAQAMGALCVNGMVVARAMVDRTLADELREACATVALRRGGWDEAANRNVESRRRSLR
jgi:TetR/AcrR family transcriptional repressor of nem operon